MTKVLSVACAALAIAGCCLAQSAPHVVFVAGDHEYRSEITLPLIAKILETHHGFRTSLVMPVDDQDSMDPKADRSLSGLEALATADCAVFYLRWRTLPDDGPYPQIQPVAWTKTYTGDVGHTARVFFTTLGHPQEFADANLRRLLLNAVY